MTKLSTARRKSLPASDFAGPGRSFPIPPGDKDHARAALRDAPHALHAGSITVSQEHAIQARARRVLRGK